ncbi:MAG TPA: rhombosortase [Steroidobacter sp.]|jgi:rhomboid family GlyGly-CTERM serine protease|nr:rhombosortase [Steroidobacteraceae bacterium]HLS81812.1 rhombosortase [Steroidobacter sp.]
MTPQRRHAPTPAFRVWLVGLTALLVLPALGGETLREALRYERSAVLDEGEYWRLLTAHFVHGDLQHLLLNAAGLVVIALLLRGAYSARAWLTIGLLSMLAIGVGLVWRQPQLDWYVGFSGVLHGLLAAGAIAWWRQESTASALALSAIVAGKLLWEQWRGALPLGGALPVVVDAHLYGAIGGVSAALALLVVHKRWPFRWPSL